jgi:hypothetical protein
MSTLKIFQFNEFEYDSQIYFDGTKIEKALVLKLFKPKEQKKKTEPFTSFQVTKIRTNLGDYNFINLEHTLKKYDVIEFNVKDWYWQNGYCLRKIGALSDSEIEQIISNKKKERKERNERRKKLISKIRMRFPYANDVGKTYVVIKKKTTRVFVHIYQTIFYGTDESWPIAKKWVYPEVFFSKYEGDKN